MLNLSGESCQPEIHRMSSYQISVETRGKKNVKMLFIPFDVVQLYLNVYRFGGMKSIDQTQNHILTISLCISMFIQRNDIFIFSDIADKPTDKRQWKQSEARRKEEGKYF